MARSTPCVSFDQDYAELVSVCMATMRENQALHDQIIRLQSKLYDLEQIEIEARAKLDADTEEIRLQLEDWANTAGLRL